MAKTRAISPEKALSQTAFDSLSPKEQVDKYFALAPWRSASLTDEYGNALPGMTEEEVRAALDTMQSKIQSNPEANAYYQQVVNVVESAKGGPLAKLGNFAVGTVAPLVLKGALAASIGDIATAGSLFGAGASGAGAGTSAGMAAPGSAADVITSMGGAGGGVTGAQAGMSAGLAAASPGAAAGSAASNVATGLGYDMLGTAATGAAAGLPAIASQVATTAAGQGAQQLTAEQVASIANNPEAIAQYQQAGMISPELLKTVSTAGATSWMDYLSTGLGLAQGIQGILGGNAQDAGAAQRALDPFAPYRSQYAQQLNQLMADPSTVTQLPGYQFQQQQGQQAIERSLAAQGRTVSGQEQLELQRYGQGLAGQAYTDQYTKLAQLSGANQGPGAGGAAYNAAIAANQQQQQAGWSQLGTLAAGAMTPNTPINRAVTGAGDYLSNLWR